MADAGIATEHIRAGQEAMARRPGAAAGSVEAGVTQDLRDSSVQAGLEKAALTRPSFNGIRNLTENNIGYRDSQGNIHTSAVEVPLLNTSNQRIDLLEQYLENGFNRMGANQATILAEVQNAIIVSPQMHDRFVNLTAAQRNVEAQRMAREYLQDPNYAEKVVELLLQRADLTHPIEDKVSPIAVKLEELRAEQTRLQTEQTEINQQVDEARNKLRLYTEDPTPPAVGPANHGRFYVELTTHQNTANISETTINTLENQTIPNLQRQLTTLQREEARVDNYSINYDPTAHAGMALNTYLTSIGLRPLATIQGEITAAETNLATENTNLTNAKNNLANSQTRINQINEERARAEQTLKDSQKNQKEINDKVTKIDKEVNEQQGKFSKAQGEKELKEAEWVRQLDNIIKDATAGKLSEEAPLAAQKIKERLEKRAADEKGEGQKRFWEYAKQQYVGPDGRPNRGVINPDRVALMRQGARVAFTWTENGRTHTERLQLNGAEQTLVDVMARGGFNQREIYNMIKDPATRTDMSNALAQEILTTYLWSGGRLSRGDVVAIHRSEWGKGMVSKAVAGRADLQAEIDNQIGKGVLNWRENIMGQLGKIEWAKFAIILLIIAGIVGGIGLIKK